MRRCLSEKKKNKEETMEVILTGKDSFKRNLVHCQVHYCIGYLGLSNSRYTLEVIPKRGIRHTDKANGLTGKIGNTIGLVIDTGLDMKQLMLTVAHEMVHVKQLAKGQLRYKMVGNEEVAYWRGKRMKDIEYFNRPWEIEAYGKQEILARRFNAVVLGVANDKRKRAV